MWLREYGDDDDGDELLLCHESMGVRSEYKEMNGTDGGLRRKEKERLCTWTGKNTWLWMAQNKDDGDGAEEVCLPPGCSIYISTCLTLSSS